MARIRNTDSAGQGSAPPSARGVAGSRGAGAGSKVASGQRARVQARTGAQPGARPSARVRKPPSLTVSRPELLADGSDRQFRQLVHSLFGFLAAHEEIRDGHARAIGLAGIEYTVLIAIAHLAQDRDVNISAVAAHLHLTGAFITTVCQRLQALGLIEKAVDRRDRRRVSLTVSAQGRRLLERLAPVQRQVNDVEFSPLSRAEFLALLDMIERLIASGRQAVALQRYLQAAAS